MSGEKTTGAAPAMQSKFRAVMSRAKDDMLAGIDYMIPVVIGGALCFGIALAIGGAGMIDDPSIAGPANNILYQIGQAGLMLFIPVCGAGIAYSKAGKGAIAPALIGSYLAYTANAGFVGAIVVGFFSGWLVNLLNKVNFPEKFEALKGLLFVPFLASIITGFLVLGVIAPPLSAVMTALTNWINSMTGGSKLVLGAILGGMIGFDYGGPFNKTASAISISFMGEGIFTLTGAIAPAMTVPGLSIFFASLLAPKKFTKKERENAPATAVIALTTISEVAIPYAAADPVPTMISTALGGAVSGAIAMEFGLEVMAPIGGVFVIPVMSNVLLFAVSLLAGTAVSTLLLVLLKKKRPQEEGDAKVAEQALAE